MSEQAVPDVLRRVTTCPIAPVATPGGPTVATMTLERHRGGPEVAARDVVVVEEVVVEEGTAIVEVEVVEVVW